MDDMTVRLDYQHRWLGNIIEDGYGPGFDNGVLANPGNVPQSALDAANHTLQQAQATSAAQPNDPAAQAAAAARTASTTSARCRRWPTPPRRSGPTTPSRSR